MTEGQKEQIKLRAAYINGIAVAVMAIGVIGLGIAIMQKERIGLEIIIPGSAVQLSYLIHLGAMKVLESIDHGKVD